MTNGFRKHLDGCKKFTSNPRINSIITSTHQRHLESRAVQNRFRDASLRRMAGIIASRVGESVRKFDCSPFKLNKSFVEWHCHVCVLP